MRLTVVLAFLVCSVADAQSDPKRPPLFASSDTNDSRGYYEYGLQQLTRNPQVAAAAFYWSARLDPLSADALYGRRIALLLSDKHRLIRYWRGDRSTVRRADIKSIDSLYFRSLMLNPFFYEKLDKTLQDAVIAEIVRQETAGGRGSPLEMEYAIQQYLRSASWGERAFRAYNEGRFEEALSHYAVAVKESRFKHYYRNMRGRLFYQLGKIDSAFSELSLAAEELRKRDAKDFVYVYESKALLEHSLGMALERLGNVAGAREAYARALQEDLSYAPAHVRLAYVAIEHKDTATALGEFDLAVQLHPDDAGLRYQYGYLLSEHGQMAEAEAQLKKAEELNPWYAAPQYAKGRIYERQGKGKDAIDAYRSFLALSSRMDPRRTEVSQRVEALSSSTR